MMSTTTDGEDDRTLKSPAKHHSNIHNFDNITKKQKKIEQLEKLKRKALKYKQQLKLLSSNINNTTDDDSTSSEEDRKLSPKKIHYHDNNEKKIINRIVNNSNGFSIIKYDEFHYLYKEHEDRLEIRLPWLETGYDWTALVPDIFIQDKKKIKVKTIPFDLFPVDQMITEEHGKNYHKHLYNDNTINEEGIIDCMEQICTFRDQYKVFIVEILYKFWFDVATKIGIYNNGIEIKNNKSFMKALLLIEEEFELKKIPLLLHVIFDFVPNFQSSIVHLVETKFNIKIIQPVKKENQRIHKDCMHLLVTKMLANERKNINTNLHKMLGIKTGISRNKNDIDEKQSVTRKKKCIYDWMIVGEFVSTKLLLIGKMI